MPMWPWRMWPAQQARAADGALRPLQGDGQRAAAARLQLSICWGGAAVGCRFRRQVACGGRGVTTRFLACTADGFEGATGCVTPAAEISTARGREVGAYLFCFLHQLVTAEHDSTRRNIARQFQHQFEVRCHAR